MFRYKTVCCVWLITFDPELSRWILSWEDSGGFERSGSYHRQEAAADDVARRMTGNPRWDRLPFGKIPPGIADIRGWERCTPR